MSAQSISPRCERSAMCWKNTKEQHVDCVQASDIFQRHPRVRLFLFFMIAVADIFISSDILITHEVNGASHLFRCLLAAYEFKTNKKKGLQLTVWPSGVSHLSIYAPTSRSLLRRGALTTTASDTVNCFWYPSPSSRTCYYGPVG